MAAPKAKMAFRRKPVCIVTIVRDFEVLCDFVKVMSVFEVFVRNVG